jgi:hypothetical protein
MPYKAPDLKPLPKDINALKDSIAILAMNVAELSHFAHRCDSGLSKPCDWLILGLGTIKAQCKEIQLMSKKRRYNIWSHNKKMRSLDVNDDVIDTEIDK